MPAEILSLDLDWFNYLNEVDIPGISAVWKCSDRKQRTRREGIRNFFENLRDWCVLPFSVTIVQEHQYLYPWSLKILDGITYRKANVVNIDEHHDFYYLSNVDCQSAESFISCGNFFAFMASHGLLSSYTWVTSDGTSSKTRKSLKDLKACLQVSKCSKVRGFMSNSTVMGRNGVFEAIYGRKFDGFIIVRSPEYTQFNRSVCHAVDMALSSVMPWMRVDKYRCREEFQHSKVRQKKKLFLK